MPRPVVVFVAAHAHQAHFLRNLLAGYGIEAQVLNEVVSEDPGGWHATPRVVVPPDDVEFAAEIVRDFEASWNAQEKGRVQDQGLPLEWADWPECPRCHQRRLTVCPKCHTASQKFPLAEFVSPEDPDQPIRLAADESEGPVLVVCPTCDEAFTPEFYRRCERCGFQFADGKDVGRLDPWTEATRGRVLWWCGAGGALLFWLYLAWRLLR